MTVNYQNVSAWQSCLTPNSCTYIKQKRGKKGGEKSKIKHGNKKWKSTGCQWLLPTLASGKTSHGEIRKLACLPTKTAGKKTHSEPLVKLSVALLDPDANQRVTKRIEQSASRGVNKVTAIQSVDTCSFTPPNMRRTLGMEWTTRITRRHKRTLAQCTQRMKDKQKASVNTVQRYALPPQQIQYKLF